MIWDGSLTEYNGKGSIWNLAISVKRYVKTESGEFVGMFRESERREDLNRFFIGFLTLHKALIFSHQYAGYKKQMVTHIKYNRVLRHVS